MIALTDSFLWRLCKRWGLGQSGWDGCGDASLQLNFQFLLMGCQQASFRVPRGFIKETPYLLTSLLWEWECWVLSLGGLLKGASFQGAECGEEEGRIWIISHLFFADDTIVFCEAKKEHLTHLSWTLFWFEAASGLRINLAKSEIFPVGEVEEVDVLAMELGCRVLCLCLIWDCL